MSLLSKRGVYIDETKVFVSATDNAPRHLNSTRPPNAPGADSDFEYMGWTGDDGGTPLNAVTWGGTVVTWGGEIVTWGS